MNVEFLKNNVDVYNAIFDIRTYKELRSKNNCIKDLILKIKYLEQDKKDAFSSLIVITNRLIDSMIGCEINELDDLNALAQSIAIQHAEILNALISIRYGNAKIKKNTELKKQLEHHLSDYNRLCLNLSGKTAWDILTQNHIVLATSSSFIFLLALLCFACFMVRGNLLWVLIILAIMFVSYISAHIIVMCNLDKMTRMSTVNKIKNKFSYLTSRKHQEIYKDIKEIINKKI